MSAPPTRRQAVAVKGYRKRDRTPSSDSSAGSFRGCRDSPSPVRYPIQRAVKSRKLHHKVMLETPPMHRHVLEEHLEKLWESHGIEFKFVQSSVSQEDMDFFEGPSPPRTGALDTSSGIVTRQVVSVPVPDSSITGEANLRKTASSAPAAQPDTKSSVLPSCRR